MQIGKTNHSTIAPAPAWQQTREAANTQTLPNKQLRNQTIPNQRQKATKQTTKRPRMLLDNNTFQRHHRVPLKDTILLMWSLVCIFATLGLILN